MSKCLDLFCIYNNFTFLAAFSLYFRHYFTEKSEGSEGQVPLTPMKFAAT